MSLSICLCDCLRACVSVYKVLGVVVKVLQCMLVMSGNVVPVHRVSKKNCANLFFVRTLSNFDRS